MCRRSDKYDVSVAYPHAAVEVKPDTRLTLSGFSFLMPFCQLGPFRQAMASISIVNTHR